MPNEVPRRRRIIDLHVYKGNKTEPRITSYLLKESTTRVDPNLSHGLQDHDEEPATPTRPAGSFSEGLEKQDGASYRKLKSEAELERALEKAGYPLPNNHLHILLSWTDQNYTAGIRKPFPEDLDRLKGNYSAPKTASGSSLTWDKLLTEAKALTKIYAELKEASEPEGITAPRSAATSPPPMSLPGQVPSDDDRGGSAKVTPGKKSGRLPVALEVKSMTWVKQDKKSASEMGGEIPETSITELKKDKIEERLEWAIECFLSAMSGFPRYQFPTEKGAVDRARAKFTQLVKAGDPIALNKWNPTALEKWDPKSPVVEQPPDSKPAGDASSAPAPAQQEIAGLIGGWLRIRLIQTDNESEIVAVDVPVGLRLGDGMLLEFDDVRASKTLRQDACTEGYHLFRIPPQQVSKRQGGMTVSPLVALNSQVAFSKQLSADHLLLTSYFQSFHDSKTTSSQQLFFAPASSQDSLNIDKRNGVLPGAIMLTPEKQGRHAIYIFTRQDQLTRARGALVTNELTAKQKTYLPLLIVSFMFGQLYSRAEEPGLTLKERKDQAVKGGLWKKAKLAGAAVLVVTATATVVGIPLVIAGVAAGMAGIKRFYKHKRITNPSEILKKRDFLLSHDAQGLDAKEERQLDALFKASDDKSETESAPSGEHKTEEKATDSELMDKHVGELIRRAYVHFDVARSKLKKVKRDESSESTEKRLGQALHHLEKGWRYLGPATVYLNVAWAAYRRSQEKWQQFAPQASLSLIEECQKIPYESAGEYQEELSKLFGPKRKVRWTYQFKKSAHKIGLASKQVNPQKVFEQRLKTFLSVASATDALPHDHNGAGVLSGEEASDIGGPSLYGEWELVGAKVTPFVNPQEDSADVRAATLGLEQLSEKVQTQLNLFHSVSDASASTNSANTWSEWSGTASEDANKLHRWLSNLPKIREAWQHEDSIEDKVLSLRRVRHDLRNYYRKTSADEKIETAALTVSEMAVAGIAQLGFLSIDETLEIPIEDSKSVTMDDVLGAVQGDVDALEEKLQHGAHRATRRGLLSGGLAALTFLVEKRIDSELKGNRKRISGYTGLLTQQARAREMVDEAIGINRGFSRQGARDVLKEGSAYAGSDLVRRVGFWILKSEQARNEFVELAGKDFQPPDPSTTKKVKSAFDPPTPLEQLGFRILPLAEYYRNMDRLRIDIYSCLAFLELQSYAAEQIEAEIFRQIEQHAEEAKYPSEQADSSRPRGVAS